MLRSFRNRSNAEDAKTTTLEWGTWSKVYISYIMYAISVQLVRTIKNKKIKKKREE